MELVNAPMVRPWNIANAEVYPVLVIDKFPSSLECNVLGLQNFRR